MTKAKANENNHLDEGNQEVDVVSKFDFDDEFPEFKGWESIGFHRALGKELWQIIVEQISNALYLFLMIYYIPLIQPYPEIAGYNGIAGGLFYAIYVIFDTGTNFGIYRFIAEYRIKDLSRMRQYIGFFIKYQMVTGLIQISLLTWYTFIVIRTGSYAYLSWMLLIILQKQWPGMLSIFKTVLSGFQHHAKVEAFNFLQGEVIEKITMIGFILIGRWWGQQNPEVGIIMGICIFTHIGNYVDDIILGFISGHYVNKIMKDYMNLSLVDVFNTKITRPVLKQMLFYGVQGSIIPVISSSINTATLIALTASIPGYVTWAALISYGSTFSSVVSKYGDFSLGSSLAESYSSGKTKLSEFYISYSFRWRYFFMLLVAMTMFSLLPYFDFIIKNFDVLSYYQGAVLFFVPMLLKRLIDPLIGYPGAIMYGTLNITEHNIIRVVEEGMKLLDLFIFVYWLKVQDSWGLFGILFLIGYSHYIPVLIKTIFTFIYIHKKILKIKIYWKSTFLGPTISALPVFGLTQFWYYTGFLPSIELLGIEIALVISMFFLFLILMLVYFPLSMLVGGWDDYMLYTFKKAVDLSGPSKPIFQIVYKLMDRMKNFAKRAGRWNMAGWSIPHEEAHEEIRDLMKTKRKLMQKNEINIAIEDETTMTKKNDSAT